MKKKIGFEYRKGGAGDETSFEIFLKYTDEKEKSSAVLGKILSRLLVREGMTCLDIGSGNGEYLRLALREMWMDPPFGYLYAQRDIYGVNKRVVWEPRSDEDIDLYGAYVKE